jgi:valyl-tRNA synthetase
MHAALQEAYADYRFHEVAGLLYDFFWGDYCDWFVEAAKPILNGQDAGAKNAILSVMDITLSGVLRLLHPLMPHVTEELWQRLGFRAPVSASGTGARKEFLLYTAPPSGKLLGHLPESEILAASTRTTALYSAIHATRNLRSEFKIPAKQHVRFLLSPKSEITNDQCAIFAGLTRASEVEILKEAPPAGTPSVLTDIGTLYMPLEGLVDLDAERKRIATEITKVEAELAKVEAKLADTSFVEKVPPPVLEDHRQRHSKWSEKLETLKTTLKTLG